MSLLKKLLRTERGERIDQPDFQAAVDACLDVMSQFLAEVLIGRDRTGGTQPKNFVLNGFEVTKSGTVVTISGGVAIVGYRDKGETKYGFILAPDESKSYDIGGYAASGGTPYKVWVSFGASPTDYRVRRFWNAQAAPSPREEPKVIPTRKVEQVRISIEKLQPGPEWVELAEIAKDGGGNLTVTDKRNFMFEGRAANTYLAVDDEWGAADDRNATRKDYGVFGLYRTIRSLQRQVQDVIDPISHWSADFLGTQYDDGSGTLHYGQSIVDLLRKKLDRNGATSINGIIKPDGDETRDFGATNKRFKIMYTRDLDASDSVTASSVQSNTLVANGAASLLGGGFVDGDLTIDNGDYTYNVDKTIYQSYPGASMFSCDTAKIKAVGGTGAGPEGPVPVMQKFAAGNVEAGLKLRLPQGSVLQDVILKIALNNGANEARFAIVRVPNSVGAPLNGESLLNNPTPYITLTSTGGAGANYENKSLSAAISSGFRDTVENDKYSYYLWVGTGVAGDDTWSIADVKVEATTTTLVPH